MLTELYRSLGAPLIVTDPETAEMIKYASNAFLATKISFINEIANICEALGADVKEVAVGMGYDARIGRQMLDAGLGWGGSCFPKDVRALAYMANIHGRNPQLLQAVMDINADQRRHLVARLRETVGGSLEGLLIGVLGLAFKPNTDDMRDAPSIDIIRLCLEEGARVKAYDPLAMGVAARLLPPEVQLAEDAYELATGCDAVLIVTEWNEFKQLDLQRLRRLMRQPVIIDGRNIYDPEQLAALGFRYRGVGRGHGEGVTKTVWPNGAVRPSPSSEKETA
jgi:UDPglucose 6-dehydrogenase